MATDTAPVDLSRRPWRERLIALSSVAAPAALAAGAVMAGTLIMIAEIASEPTAAPGIDSSAWTPLTAITSFFFGLDAYHASFEPLPLAFGVAAHLACSLLFGAAGVASLVWLLGDRPSPSAAAVLGLGYGLTVEVLFLNLVVNAVQEENTVYESLPQWGWWVAHAAFGLTLYLAATALFSRAAGQSPRAGPSTAAPAGESSR